MRKLLALLAAALLLSVSVFSAFAGSFDTDIATKAGTSTADWYVFTLRMQGTETDFSLYNAYLDRALANNTYGAVESQRIALAKLAMGFDDTATVDATAGKGGIMSYIFALILMNNGAVSADFTRESLADILTDMQLSDGGFAVSGSVSNPDVTSLAVVALAPLNRATVIDSAIDCLATNRQPSGGYKSYGTENCEASAMVLIALAATDRLSDERFSGLIDILQSYAVEDGYAHTSGGAKNVMATVQAECALAAIDYAEGGHQPFVFTEVSPPEIISLDDEPQPQSLPLKQIIIAVIALCGVIAIAVYALQKKHLKALMALILTMLILLTAAFVKIETPDEHFAADVSGNPIGSAIISIILDDINLPPLLTQTTAPIYDGDTVYDLLLRVTKQNKIAVVGSSYVSAIGGIAEMQYGAESGWMYSVGSAYPTSACTDYLLKDGDTVVWQYVIKLKQ